MDYHQRYTHSTSHTQITQDVAGYRCYDCNKKFNSLQEIKEVECVEKLIPVDWLPSQKK